MICGSKQTAVRHKPVGDDIRRKVADGKWHNLDVIADKIEADRDHVQGTLDRNVQRRKLPLQSRAEACRYRLRLPPFQTRSGDQFKPCGAISTGSRPGQWQKLGGRRLIFRSPRRFLEQLAKLERETFHDRRRSLGGFEPFQEGLQFLGYLAARETPGGATMASPEGPPQLPGEAFGSGGSVCMHAARCTGGASLSCPG